MFIQSVSKGGGYRGDVNTAFRQGRQDAYRDYIDNFTYALEEDRKQNAFNQTQVEQAAANYNRELDMGKNARADVLDFTDSSSKIMASTDGLYQQAAKSGELRTVGENGKTGNENIGYATANVSVNSAGTNLNNSVVNYATSGNKVDNLPNTLQEQTVKSQTGVTQAENSQTVEQSKQQYAKMLDFTQGQKEQDFINWAFDQEKQKNPNVNKEEFEASLRGNPQFGEAVSLHYIQSLQATENKILGATRSLNERTEKQPVVKFDSGKSVSGDEFTALSNGAVELGKTANGNVVFQTAGGDILIKSGDGTGVKIAKGTKNGVPVSVQETLEAHQIQLQPQAQQKPSSVQSVGTGYEEQKKVVDFNKEDATRFVGW